MPRLGVWLALTLSLEMSGMPTSFVVVQQSPTRILAFGALNLVKTCQNWPNCSSHFKSMNVHGSTIGDLANFESEGSFTMVKGYIFKKVLNIWPFNFEGDGSHLNFININQIFGSSSFDKHIIHYGQLDILK